MRHFIMSGMSLYIHYNQPLVSKLRTSDLSCSRPWLATSFPHRQLDVHPLQPIQHCLLRNPPLALSVYDITT